MTLFTRHPNATPQHKNICKHFCFLLQTQYKSALAIIEHLTMVFRKSCLNGIVEREKSIKRRDTEPSREEDEKMFNIIRDVYLIRR